MSTRAGGARDRRGRAVAQQSNNSMRIFYLVLVVIAIAGVALVATQLFSGGAPVATGDLSSYPSKGDANAPVTVVEYADYQCPGCAAYATQVAPQITKDYIDTGKVRFVYHEFPLTNIHRNAISSAEAGRCAADQGKFWPMHDLLFANQARWERLSNPQPEYVAYAEVVGVNKATFEQCLANRTHQTTIEAAGTSAMQAKIQQTPTFVINGKQYGAADLRLGIDAALAAAGQK